MLKQFTIHWLELNTCHIGRMCTGAFLISNVNTHRLRKISLLFRFSWKPLIFILFWFDFILLNRCTLSIAKKAHDLMMQFLESLQNVRIFWLCFKRLYGRLMINSSSFLFENFRIQIMCMQEQWRIFGKDAIDYPFMFTSRIIPMIRLKFSTSDANKNDEITGLLSVKFFLTSIEKFSNVKNKNILRT